MKKPLKILIIACIMITFAEQVSAQANQVPVVLSSGNLLLCNFLGGKKKQRDSLISAVESNWIAARQLIEKDNYSDATSKLKEILAEIDIYKAYCSKNKKRERVFKDTVNLLISNCRFLESLVPQINKLTLWSDSIPDNSDELLLKNRHQLLAIQKRCKDAINEQIRSNPDKRGAIRFGFRKSIIKLNLLDSLLRDVYDQEKDEFSLKCKFFYNRAVESNDTAQIRKFVNDCDYYQVDKEWCTRARMILAVTDTQSVKAEAVITKEKLSDTEMMKLQYQQAMISGRIDLLENYIAKYNRKKIRKSESKIDSVRIMLEKVKKEIAAQAAYDKAHPLFANADPAKLDISIKGLSLSTQNVFRDVIEKNRDQLKNIHGIRFPASMQLDYSGSHPTLYMNAFINCGRDVQSTVTDSGTLFTIKGVTQLMRFLNHIKKSASKSVQEKTASEKIALAAYVVRLRKSTDEYITFYGKENIESEDSEQDFSYYDFFDLTVNDQKDIRFPNKPSDSVMLLKSESESEKNLLGMSFFGK
jgi:hypothetical protein